MESKDLKIGDRVFFFDGATVPQEAVVKEVKERSSAMDTILIQFCNSNERKKVTMDYYVYRTLSEACDAAEEHAYLLINWCRKTR